MKKWLLFVLLVTVQVSSTLAQSSLILNSSNPHAYDYALHNPAGIPFSGRPHGAIGIQFLHTGLSNDQLRNNIGYFVLPLGLNSAIGLRAIYFTSDLFQQGEFSILAGRKFLDERFSFGFNVNLLTYSFDRDKFQLVDANDPVIDKGTSKNAVSVGTGVMVRVSEKVTVGGSIDHLNRPDISIANAGFNKDVLFKFGLTFKTFPYTLQFDFQSENHQGLFQGGIRRSLFDDKVNVFAGYNFFESEGKEVFFQIDYLPGPVGLSYNFQYPVNELNQFANGTHLITLLFNQGSPAPHIGLVLPSETETTVKTNVIKIAGQITDKIHGIDQIRIKKNGQLIASLEYEQELKVVDLQRDLDLDEGKNEFEIIAYAQKKSTSKKFRVTYAPVYQPPQIAILSPQDSVITGNNYRLTARITDNIGLQRVQVRLNEKEIQTYTYPKRYKQADINLDIPLEVGKNNIKIVADNARKSDSRSTDITVALPIPEKPPTITILNPQPNEQIKSKNLNLEFVIENVDTVTNIWIIFNGDTLKNYKVRGFAEWLKQNNSYRITRNLELRDGPNLIQIFAVNRAGFSSKDLDVNFTAPLSPPGYRKTWAVIIGIDDYPGPQIPRLNAAVSDARSIEAVLKDTYHFDHIISLYGENATKDHIIAALSDSLRLTKPEDGVIVYFAGHGDTEKTSQGDLGYILPYDGAWKSYESNITMGIIQETSRVPNAKHVFYILDSCFSGLMLVRGVLDRTIPSSIKDLYSKYSRYVLTAGRKGETALDGVFARRLVQGLLGEADNNKDGYITSRELSMFVSQKVELDARFQNNHQQTPQFGSITADEGEFIFKIPVTSHKQ